jgi:hypothetical protein
MYLLCWRRCRPNVSPRAVVSLLLNVRRSGSCGKGLGAVAVIVGVGSASGGGSASTDLLRFGQPPQHQLRSRHVERMNYACILNHDLAMGSQGQSRGAGGVPVSHSSDASKDRASGCMGPDMLIYWIMLTSSSD